jgi:PAS domain S-box-containing protein
MDQSGLIEALRRVWTSGVPEHLPPFFYRDAVRQGWRENHIYRIPSGEVVALFDDVTERMQAEEALQQSEERLKALFDTIRDGVFVHPLHQQDGPGNFEMVNDSACRMLGYTRDELLLMGPLDLDETDRLKEYVPDAIACLHADGHSLIDIQLTRKDRTRIPVEISSNRVEICGRPYVVSTVRDVSVRKRYEQDLLENRQFLQSIYEGVNHSIFVVDVLPDGSYRYKGINRRHQSLTGISNEDIAGKTPAQILEPDVVEEVVRRYDGCISQAKSMQYEEILPFKGKETWWETVLNPVFDDNGRICRIIGTSINITERKLAENGLKKLSVAVQQSPAVVVVTDPFGHIEYVNPRFTQYTGYSFEEVFGKNPRILQSGLTPKEVYEDLWRTILSGNVWHGEFYNRKKNGELYWEDAVISAIRNERGEITNFVAVKEDITEKKKLWGELITAKEKAEESDRLKSAFLANISHEIRTPMNGILGFSELLKEPDLTGEERENYIGMIHQSGHRMLHLLNELIEISRIEAGERTLYIKETQLNEILNDLYVFYREETEKNGLLLSCVPGLPDAESVIFTDGPKLKQVLINLIQNALKFTHAGKVDFGYQRKDDMLEFFVIDSGIGIQADVKDKIFERFRQADNALTRKYEGAGLGLSISRAYVEMLGGTIRVESEPGDGSSFYFTLPFHPSCSGKPQFVPADIHEPFLFSPNLTLLIAEDDYASSLLLKQILKGENITILHAGNGQEAVELVKLRPEINLVLMDIKMPLMNGFEATRHIRCLRPDVPIIAQTAFASKEDREKAAEAGCDAFISKPIKKNELLELMQMLIRR